MALVTCQECGTQVSSLAAACPKCAAPIAEQAAAKVAGKPIVTTELTSKKFKRHKLIAAPFVIVGLIMIFTGNASIGDGGAGLGLTAGIGALLFLAGLIAWFVARIRAWWHHG